MNNKIINLVKKGTTNNSLIAIKANYNSEAIFFYTISNTKEFFFGVEEFDFALDGYQIRRFDDFEDAIVIKNFSAKINVYEGLLEQIKPYKIDLTSFETIFNSLLLLDSIISIEREYDDEDTFFLIGRIVKVTEVSVWFKDFNVDGKYNEEINIIPYDIITTIRFDSRYINVWSKYLNEVENEN